MMGRVDAAWVSIDEKAMPSGRGFLLSAVLRRVLMGQCGFF